MKGQMRFPFVKGEPIAAIHKRTIYDVPEKMKALTREIESGKYGRVTDAVIALRCEPEDGGNRCFEGFHYGTGTADTCIGLTERIRLRILGVL